jgi:hypothetical protein
MIRICFDTASNFYHDYEDPFLYTPSDVRRYFRSKKMREKRFHGATACNSQDQKFTDFTGPLELLSFLLQADEIISFNGRKWDYIVLEQLIGEREVAALWLKPHYDLVGWRSYWSLKDSVSHFLPEIASSFDEVETERCVLMQSLNQYDDFTRGHLANTYRDTKFTFELLERYIESGDSSFKFQDDDQTCEI